MNCHKSPNWASNVFLSFMTYQWYYKSVSSLQYLQRAIVGAIPRPRSSMGKTNSELNKKGRFGSITCGTFLRSNYLKCALRLHIDKPSWSVRAGEGQVGPEIALKFGQEVEFVKSADLQKIVRIKLNLDDIISRHQGIQVCDGNLVGSGIQEVEEGEFRRVLRGYVPVLHQPACRVINMYMSTDELVWYT